MTSHQKTKLEWRKLLTEEQFNVCFNHGTERPFTGKYTDCKDNGVYHCVCCGEALFDSISKYNSGSGWPSFWSVVKGGGVNEKRDETHGMSRVEVTCRSCDAHLGHVFDDGPQPTGLRYCINSVCLELKGT